MNILVVLQLRALANGLKQPVNVDRRYATKLTVTVVALD